MAKALGGRLRARGLDPLETREPGGTPVGDRLRSLFVDRTLALDPLCELFVVCAARAQHVSEVIGPALAAGRIVVCDRFADATVAYQGFGRGLDLTFVRSCADAAAEGLEPDLTLLLDVRWEIARERLENRAAGTEVDRLEAELESFHERVRAGYLELAHAEPNRFVVLDAAHAPQTLADEAWRCVAPHLEVR